MVLGEGNDRVCLTIVEVIHFLLQKTTAHHQSLRFSCKEKMEAVVSDIELSSGRGALVLIHSWLMSIKLISVCSVLSVKKHDANY